MPNGNYKTELRVLTNSPSKSLLSVTTHSGSTLISNPTAAAVASVLNFKWLGPWKLVNARWIRHYHYGRELCTYWGPKVDYV